jgi:hypothetical protein
VEVLERGVAARNHVDEASEIRGFVLYMRMSINMWGWQRRAIAGPVCHFDGVNRDIVAATNTRGGEGGGGGGGEEGG